LPRRGARIPPIPALPECDQKKEYLEWNVATSPISELIVKELTPSLTDDFLLFFDSVAFVDNPDWSDCYCSAC